MIELPKWNLPVISAALQRWTIEQQLLIASHYRATGKRPDELEMPAAIYGDAVDFLDQLNPNRPSALTGDMTAFGIPVRVVEASDV